MQLSVNGKHTQNQQQQGIVLANGTREPGHYDKTNDLLRVHSHQQQTEQNRTSSIYLPTWSLVVTKSILREYRVESFVIGLICVTYRIQVKDNDCVGVWIVCVCVCLHVGVCCKGSKDILMLLVELAHRATLAIVNSTTTPFNRAIPTNSKLLNSRIRELQRRAGSRITLKRWPIRIPRNCSFITRHFAATLLDQM